MKSYRSRMLALLALAALAAAVIFPSFSSTRAGGGTRTIDPYRSVAPNIDVNATSAGLRKATAAQVAALDQFKNNYGSQAVVRWNSYAGSPDVIRGFQTAASSDTPENVARSFVAANSTLFGVDPSTLVLVDQKEALGGYLLRFQQRSGGLNVLYGGLGFVMTANKEIRMV